MSGLVLSLFPGLGLMDLAFEEAEFTVVRGPDLLWGGDVRRFKPPSGIFDGVIGGPPCQCFSPLTHMVRHNAARTGKGYQVAENLIPEFVRCVREAAPRWFLMENVPASPCPFIGAYGCWNDTLNNRNFGGVQNRERRFTFGLRGATMREANLWRWLQLEALQPALWEPAILASGKRRTPVKIGGSGKVKRLNKSGASRRSVAEALELQGLPPDFFAHSPFTARGQQKMLGNGVPLYLGRAVACSVKAALQARECALEREVACSI